MPNKEIKFVATIDDSQITTAMANIQQKMKSMQAFSTSYAQLTKSTAGGNLPQMSPQSQQAFEQAFKRQTDNAKAAYMEQKTLLDRASAQQSNITKEINEQINAARKLNKESKEYEDSQQRIASLKKDQSKSDEEVMRLTQTSGKAAQSAGMRLPTTPPPPSMFAGVVQSLGGAAAVIAGIAKSVQIGTSIYRGMGEAATVAASARGAAMQGTAGREVEAIYGGRSGVEAAFMPEKAQATAAAMEILRRRQNTTGLDIGAKIVGGTAAGAGAGALAGSVIPGLGTAVGGTVGGIAGLLGSAGSVLSDKNSLYAVMEALGSKSAGQARQGLLAQEFAENYNKTRQGLIEQNPFKKAAAEQYNSNWRGDLQFQRQMGLNYGSFTGEGGFRGTATAAGFEDRQAMEMAQQIMASGGSTGAAGAKNSVLGMQAQRNFNLTNAGSILGKLGSANSDQGENKEALIRILAEGTKLGFDGSHYVEESRKFSESVSEIVARSGGSNVADVANAARGFSSFVNDSGTTAGMGAAKSMYERYQQMSSQTTGARGTIRAAGFMSDDILGQISQQSKINLAAIPEENLTVNHPEVKKAAREAGVSPQEVIDRISTVNQKSMSRRDTGGAAVKLQEYQRTHGVLNAQRAAAIGGNVEQLWEQVSSDVALDTGAMTEQENNAATMKRVGIRIKDRNALPSGTKANRAMLGGYGDIGTQLGATGPTGKVEDESARTAAEASDQMLKSFRSMKDELVPSTEAVHKFNEELRKTVEIISKMPGGADAMAKAFGNQVGNTTPSGGTQEQTTNPQMGVNWNSFWNP